ncbi:MAG: 2-hydroxyacid dehydrogenase [Alphaproteobacteria bacterium]|nr:2-hydroxyacid dehydrogenase [Alphaproteobacteria bacterium]
MSKPEILELLDVHPGTTAKLDADYRLHKLWEAPDQGTLIDQVAPSIRAVVTNGIAGIKGELIERLPKLEIIGVLGVGVDAVDLKTAKARGIRVSNTPDVLTIGVAELAMAILLDVARKITWNDRYLRDGRWPKEGDPPLSSSLAGRTLGVLGMGRIGQAIAERAKVFGMDIIYGGPSRKPDLPYDYHADPVALARAADVLMVSCRGGAETAGLVNAEVIDAVGPAGWLINISRGSVVDEPALIDALGNGRLGAAGLDVFANEPEVPAALFAMDNVVLQPHQGSACIETRDAMGDLVLANLRAHFEGLPLPTAVV